MSLETCRCGKEFLTEADDHAYILVPTNEPNKHGMVWKINCGCYFKTVPQAIKTIQNFLWSDVNNNKNLESVKRVLQMVAKIYKTNRGNNGS